MTRIISVDEAAQRLGVSPRSLLDKRFRLRTGLPAVKIGMRRIGFDEGDIEKLVERGRERLPRARRRWTNFLLARCYTFVCVSLRVALTPDRSTLRFLLRLIASALELLH